MLRDQVGNTLKWEKITTILENVYQALKLSTQSLLMAMLHSLIARRRFGPQTHDGLFVKL